MERSDLEALRDDLRSSDAERAVQAWERLVLAALGVAPEQAPIASWARVYADVSRQLTEDADSAGAQPSSALGLKRAAPADLDAVWGLVYSARTFLLAQQLLRQSPAPGGPFVDLGAGWGPFAFAYALAHPAADITLVDVAGARLAKAASLFELAGLPRPRIEVGDARRAQPRAGAAAVALPYSLGEMTTGARDEAETGAHLLDAWTRPLQPGGRTYVLEPGTRTSARRLQGIRDLWARRSPRSIVAPCAALHCPRSDDPRDWCHFTWSLALGPLGQAIANTARRRWQEVHASWLVLSPTDEPSPARHPARLLELRSADKTKAIVRLCTPTGEVPLTALRRHRDAYDALTNLPPGTLLDLEAEKLEQRGDGLRLVDPSALQVLSKP